MFDQIRQVSRDNHTQHPVITESGAPHTGHKVMNSIRTAVSALLHRLPGAGSNCDRLAILAHDVVSEVVEIPRKAAHAVALFDSDSHLFTISARGPAEVRPHNRSATARDDVRPADTDSGESNSSTP